MQTENLAHISTGEPTYWPSDRRKMPDLIDFGVVKRIPTQNLHAESSFDLSSDHSPIITIVSSRFTPNTRIPTLSSKETNWEHFRTHIKGNLTLAVPLKNNMDIENYVHQLVYTIQQAAWNSTPNPQKIY